MIRNLKILGLALVAVFALSALAASAASAQEKGWITSTGPFTLKGEETGGVGSNALTAFGLRLECPGSTYTGHQLGTTPHQLLPNKSTHITLTPHYKQANHNCRLNPGNFPATIDMNGCDYVAHLENTTPAGNKEHTYGVTFDVICPVGKEITVTFFTNEHDETVTNKPFCIIHVKEQLGLKGAHAKDTTNGHIDLTGTIQNIHLSKTNVHAPLLCPNQTITTGQFDLDVTVKGLNAEGGSTAISISEA